MGLIEKYPWLKNGLFLTNADSGLVQNLCSRSQPHLRCLRVLKLLNAEQVTRNIHIWALILTKLATCLMSYMEPVAIWYHHSLQGLGIVHGEVGAWTRERLARETRRSSRQRNQDSKHKGSKSSWNSDTKVSSGLKLLLRSFILADSA